MQCKEIYLMRHGDTGYSGRYIGSSDVSLSSEGIKQTKELCAELSKIAFDEIICSPMIRCQESIETLHRDVNVQFVETFKEVDFGFWEKKTFAEIAKEDKPLVEQWAKQDSAFAFPGGERLTSFYQRITRCADTLCNTKGKTILVVSHGGVIRHLICELLHLAKENYLLFDVATACYSTLKLYEEGGVLTGFNLKG